MTATASAKAKTRREGNSASLIYDQVRADIMAGRLASGSILSQLAIAKAHGTSRGPVREAMRRLEQDQLITGAANKQFSVAPFELAELESTLILHLSNVALAIRVSAPRLADEDLAALDAAVDRMEAALDHDVAEWEAGYRAYALTITGQAGDKVVALVAGLIDTIQRFRVNLLDRFPRVYAGSDAFRQITVAARAGDGRRASELFVACFGRISSLILAGVAPRHDAARLRGYIEALAPDRG